MLFVLLLLCVGSRCTLTCARSSEDQTLAWARLLTWGQQHGALVSPGLGLARTSCGASIKAFAPVSCESVLHVPSDLIVTRARSLVRVEEHIVLCGSDHSVFGWETWQLQAAFIALECGSSDSVWHVFCAALPCKCQGALCAGADALRVVDGGDGILSGAAQTASTIAASLNQMNAVLHSPRCQGPSADELRWAASIVRSRAWPAGVVPFFDMFNHRTGGVSPVVTADGGMSLVLEDEIGRNDGHCLHEGDTVWLTYGDSRPTLDFFLLYGFLPSLDGEECRDEQPHTGADVDYGVLSSATCEDRFLHSVARQGRGRGWRDSLVFAITWTPSGPLQEEDAAALLRAGIAQHKTDGEVNRLVINATLRYGTIDPNVVAAFRVMSLSSDAKDRKVTVANILKRDRQFALSHADEVRSLAQFVWYLAASTIHGAPGTAFDDANALCVARANQTDDGMHAMALELRARHRAVLRSSVDAWKEQWKAIPEMKRYVKWEVPLRPPTRAPAAG